MNGPSHALALGDAENYPAYARSHGRPRISMERADVEVDISGDDDFAYLLPALRPIDRASPNENPWFDDWLGAGGKRLKGLLTDVTNALADRDVVHGKRQRARRPIDQENYAAAVELVVANLAHAALMGEIPRDVNIVTGRKTKGASRYDSKARGKPFLGILDALGELGLLERRPSFKRGQASFLRPTGMFQSMVRQRRVTLADFRETPGREVIELRRKFKTRENGQDSQRVEVVDYVDNPDTIRMRAEIRRINAALEAADISFADDGHGAVDTQQRTLRRIFNISGDDPLPQRFDRNGRMFGGFWIGLQRERRGRIRIEGEKVIYLDYASTFLRLAYAQAGATPPLGDPYAIPGLEGHRGAAKVAVNALLFAPRKRTKWPTMENPGDEPPPGFTWPQFLEGFARLHPEIVPHTGKGLGHMLMWLESEVMIGVLTRLHAMEIVALPVHDAIIVKGSEADISEKVMKEVAREVASADIPVKVDYFDNTLDGLPGA